MSNWLPSERQVSFEPESDPMRKQILEGIKIADFSWVVVGSVVTRCLADFGATVVRIESATNPDILRVSPPFKDSLPGLNRSGYFANYNANKHGLSLNLKHPKGLAVAKRLIAWADVVCESFTPGTMADWGLGYEDLKRIKPEIIMLSTCNLGQTGPLARQPGYGTQLVSLAGFTHLSGWPDRLPAQPYGAYTDTIAPHFAIAGIMAALDYRRRTGRGQYLDLSQLEAAIHFLAPVILDYTVNGQKWIRLGNRCSQAAPHGVYPCRGEDRWCAIAVFSDQEWQALCHIVGHAEWGHDPRFDTLSNRKQNEDELDRLIGLWTRERQAEEVIDLLQAAGVACGVVQTGEDIHEDPQLQHRRHLQVLHHPEIGLHSYDNQSFQLSETPSRLERPGPCLGEHTEYVCKEFLGMSDEEFVTLLNEGVFE